MKSQRLVFTLTALNFLLLVFLLAQLRPVQANPASTVLRGSALEIVDARGRVRASIVVHPANDTFQMPDGTRGYPETVMLRLIDQNGRPEVKIGASVQGGGVGVVGETDEVQARMGANRAEASLHLQTKAGGERVFKP
jgi:hypothetical protein